MLESLPSFHTVGQIAQRFGVPLHRVEYVLRSRKNLKPRGIAGVARCFDEATVVEVGRILDAIEAARRSGAPL